MVEIENVIPLRWWLVNSVSEQHHMQIPSLYNTNLHLRSKQPFTSHHN